MKDFIAKAKDHRYLLLLFALGATLLFLQLRSIAG